MEKLTTTLVNITILFILSLKEELQRMSVIWILIIPCQFLLTALLVFVYPLDMNSSISIENFIIQRFQELNSDIAHTVLLNGLICITAVLFRLYGIFLKLKTPFDELDRYQSHLNFIVTLTAFLILIV